MRALAFALLFSLACTASPPATATTSALDGELARRVGPSLGRGRPRADGTILVEGRGASAYVGEGARIAAHGSAITIGATAIGRGGSSPPLRSGRARADARGATIARGRGIEEWWRAVAGGLEHGLTIASRPDGRGALRASIALRGEGVRIEHVAPDALRLAVGEGTARYGNLLVLDADLREVPAHFEARSGIVVDVVIDDARARYPLVIDPLLVIEEGRSRPACTPSSACRSRPTPEIASARPSR